MNELTFKQILEFKEPTPVWVSGIDEYGLARGCEVMFFDHASLFVSQILRNGGKIYKVKVARK